MTLDRYRLAALDPAEQVEPLHALWRHAFTQEAEWLGLTPATAPALRVGPRDLALGSDTWLGAWDGHDLVGGLAWGADEADPQAQCISAVIVHAAHQRQGVATRLVHALAALSGRSPLSAHAAAGNAAAAGLFQAQGFRAVHRWLDAEGVRRVRWQRPGGGPR